jgi:hypothetical protein
MSSSSFSSSKALGLILHEASFRKGAGAALPQPRGAKAGGMPAHPVPSGYD